MSDLISIHNLSKIYKGQVDYALNEINLNISKSDIYGIVGPNGAGKTTLLRIISGILKKTSGNIVFNTIKNNNFKSILGYVPQDISLYEELSIQENINFFGKLYKLKSSEIINKSKSLLKIFDICSLKNKKIKSLSGGIKRRVNLLIGVLHNPKFIILDEPTVGVDVNSKKIIIDFLLQLNKHGTTIIYTSHLLNEAQEICNKIAILKNGKIIENDYTKNILEKYPEITSLEDVFIKLTNE